MPNIKSAVKRMRQSEESRLRNRSEKSQLNTVRRRLYTAIEAGNLDDSKTEFRAFCSALDKAVKHGVVKKNACDRYKSRANVRVNAIAQS